MKLKTTLILFAVFIVLFAFVYFFEIKKKRGEEAGELLVDLASEEVQKIIFKKEGETITFQRDGEDWLIVEPLFLDFVSKEWWKRLQIALTNTG